MNRAPLIVSLVAVALAVAGAAAWWALSPGGAAGPNVVLVIGCTMRRDQLGVYGGLRRTTPFLDALAAEGTRFEGALATSSWTREAAVALITGRVAPRWGMSDPEPGVNRRVLTDEATTLAEHLQAAGYRTLGVTANPNLNEIYGMAQGFDRYEGTGTGAFSKKRRIDGDQVTEAALAMVDAGDGPFFLQTVYIDAHLPRTVSDEERARFGRRAPKKVATYRATLHRTDQAIAALEAGLAERGFDATNTLFVVIADHGEGLDFPKHHGGAHGTRMYDSTLAIPWIVRGPGVPAGGVVEGLASGEDLTPTVLGLVGLDAETDGRDWSDRVRDPSPTDRDRVYALSMYGDADVASVWTPTTQCQRDFGSAGAPMPTGCFDRATDPRLSSPGPPGPLDAELVRWRAEALAEGERYPVVVASPDLTTTEQLELLGYVE